MVSPPGKEGCSQVQHPAYRRIGSQRHNRVTKWQTGIPSCKRASKSG